MINLNHFKNAGKHHTSNDSKLKASIHRRRNIPRLLFMSKITWSSSVAPESGPTSIPEPHFNINKNESLV